MSAGFIKDTKPTRQADQISLVNLVECFFACPGRVTRKDLKKIAKANQWSQELLDALDEVLVDAYENHEWGCMESGHWTFAYAQKGREYVGIPGNPPDAEALKG